MKPSLELDIHCHLIPGVDEGSRSLGESVLMAQALERLGVSTVHATAHQFRFGNSFGNDDLRRRTSVLIEHLRQAGVQLRVVPSAEYLLNERLLDALERSEELMTWPEVSSEGAGTCLLVEIPLADPIVNVGRAAALFIRRGLQPVMAHPERVRALFSDPRRVLGWLESGWRLQLDLLSLVGSYGREAVRLAELFLSQDLYDYAGSDLHRSSQIDSLNRAHAALRQAFGSASANP